MVQRFDTLRLTEFKRTGLPKNIIDELESKIGVSCYLTGRYILTTCQIIGNNCNPSLETRGEETETIKH